MAPDLKKRRATYADIERLPEHLIGEIIDGDLIVSPRPAPPHAVAASTLGMDIGGPFHRGRGGPGGWWILDEPELHLGQDVLVPDLAGWRRERMPNVPRVPAFELPPDWLCEVLSPSTVRVDRARKMGVYARFKVQHLWFVDPIAKTLEVFRLVDGAWQVIAVHEGDTKVRAEPFDAVELDLAAMWISPDEPPPAP